MSATLVIEPIPAAEREAAAIICGHKIINDLGYEDHANFHGFVQEVLQTTVGLELSRLRASEMALLEAVKLARSMFLDLERGIAPSRADFNKIGAAIAKATERGVRDE